MTILSLLNSVEDANGPFPAPSRSRGPMVEAKSLKKAFEKERMTRQNAEYLVRSLVNGFLCGDFSERPAVEAICQFTQTIWIPAYLPDRSRMHFMAPGMILMASTLDFREDFCDDVCDDFK